MTNNTLTNLKNSPDIVGQKVSHKSFGEGTLTSVADTNYLFSSKKNGHVSVSRCNRRMADAY